MLYFVVNEDGSEWVSMMHQSEMRDLECGLVRISMLVPYFYQRVQQRKFVAMKHRGRMVSLLRKTNGITNSVKYFGVLAWT